MKEASTCKPVRCLSWALCTPQPVLLAPVQQQTSYFARRTATVFTREYAISIAETCALLQPYKTLCFYLFPVLTVFLCMHDLSWSWTLTASTQSVLKFSSKHHLRSCVNPPTLSIIFYKAISLYAVFNTSWPIGPFITLIALEYNPTNEHLCYNTEWVFSLWELSHPPPYPTYIHTLCWCMFLNAVTSKSFK